VLQPEGEVLFRGSGQVHDPQFAAAIFHGAIVGLVIK
jgi:hypothetical protein